MDWIQQDHRYLALGLELIVGVGRPKFERLFPKSEAFLARRCPGPRVHLLGPDLDSWSRLGLRRRGSREYCDTTPGVGARLPLRRRRSNWRRPFRKTAGTGTYRQTCGRWWSAA